MDDKILVTRSSMPPYEEYCEAIKDLWESHWLTNMGKYHNKLEHELAAFFNVPEVSLIVNGHMSLELAIQAMNFPKGSEIITTPFKFISTTHAIIRSGLQPVFCDVNIADGTIDVSKIENLITPKTVAIVPVHIYGNICDYNIIGDIAYKYGLKVIYDAAHAFGVEHNGVSVANFGDASCFSFHATKCFNTIEGGAITFSEHSFYEKIRDLKNFGIRSEETVVGVGANAKMNEFSAIMGLLNLKYFEREIEKRRNIVGVYKKLLNNIDGIRILLKEEDGKKNNYGYMPIVIDEKVFGHTRDEVYEYLKINNIYSRKYFYPLTSDQVCFKNKYKHNELYNARKLSDNVLVLPLYADLETQYVERIVSCISNFK